MYPSPGLVIVIGVVNVPPAPTEIVAVAVIPIPIPFSMSSLGGEEILTVTEFPIYPLPGILITND